jgi:hypothetical protein
MWRISRKNAPAPKSTSCLQPPAGRCNPCPNLTVKKISKQVLSRCGWGHYDYSLRGGVAGDQFELSPGDRAHAA